MVTKAQAVEAGSAWGTVEFHYTGRHECSRIVGPRGGIATKITTVRTSGKCQTWKRDPERFRLPVKYGLYESGAIEAHNARDFHLASECPLNGHEGPLVEDYGQSAADGAACRAMANALAAIQRARKAEVTA